MGTNRKRTELPKEIPGLEYYPLRRSWTRKIVPHLQEKKLNAILVRDFNRYTLGMWNIFFRPGMLPEQIDTCDWRLDKRRPYPRYWQYVRHGACHWIVNFALRLAMLAEPNRTWRIISSDGHSTVWDGRRTLFDFNFQALGFSSAETWKILRAGGGLKMLKSSEELDAFEPEKDDALEFSIIRGGGCRLRGTQDPFGPKQFGRPRAKSAPKGISG